jgi:16S rRNA (adenine1518-N6/adenine1519-N6)-dimethyltransferase
MATAKKRFGQNFLIDPRKAESLVHALELKPDEIVIEVGPGTGALTERILKTGANLIAVELDRELISPLKEKFGRYSNFKIIESDFIKFDPGLLGVRNFKLIGNLPYNISGAMMEWLIAYNDLIQLAVITVQREVALRLKALPGTRAYGSLSVMVQSYFDIRKLFDIPPGCFSPRPKVFSRALCLRPDRKIDAQIRYEDFRDFMRGCFAQKRKTLANSIFAVGIAAGLNFSTRAQVENIIVAAGHDINVRAEQLSLNEFVELYKLMQRLK